MSRASFFTWDHRKAEANERRHDVGFDEATSVFLDDDALLVPDPLAPAAESRFLIIGLSPRLRILIVCHAYQEEKDLVRLISARKASPGEAACYHQRFCRR